jgi:hypothetical protein
MYIGFAAALGQPANVPFVIAILARDLIPLGPTGQGFDLTQELLDVLDAGPLLPVPRSYIYAWWMGHAAPKENEIMGALNISEIMAHYYDDEDKYTPFDHVNHSCPPAANWSNEAQQALLAVPHRIRQHVMHAETGVRKEILLSRRRAAGFYQLWEAALLKETDSDIIATPAVVGASQVIEGSSTTSLAVKPNQSERRTTLRRAGKKAHAAVPTIPKRLTNGELARMFTEYSARELTRMQQDPATKWTWGIDLTESDVAGIIRAADNNCRIPHSDYDKSLPMGNMRGGESSLETGSLEQSLPHSVVYQSPVPELASDDIPTHFASLPLRRPRSAVPEGLPAFNITQTSPPDLSGTAHPAIQTPESMQPEINDADLLALASTAIQTQTPPSGTVDIHAADAAAAGKPHATKHQETEIISCSDVSLLALANLALPSDAAPPLAHSSPDPSSQASEWEEMLQLADMALAIRPSNPRNADEDGTVGTIGTSGTSGTSATTPPVSDDIESEMLALADFALHPEHHISPREAADPSCPAPSSLLHSSDSQEEEMLELARLALPFITETDADNDPASDIEDADDETETSDEIESAWTEDYDSAPVVPGPWTAEHFPRVSSDIDSETDDEN